MSVARLACLGPLVMLMACDQPPMDPEPAEPPVLPEEAGAAMPPGLYALGDEDTVFVRAQLNEDGTFVDIDEDGAVVLSGTWENEGETICFDPEGEGKQRHCWRNDPPRPDGSFVSRRTDGGAQFLITPLQD
jgi:hypothetical protein